MANWPELGVDPQNITCPYCHEEIRTQVTREPTYSTHSWAFFLTCLFAPLGFLPYCIDACQNSDHYCPNCNAFLGTYGEL